MEVRVVLEDPPDMRAEKNALRKSVQALLRKIPEQDVQKFSAAVAERVARLPNAAESRSVSAYLSMPKGEIGTGPLLQWLFDKPGDKTRIFVPTITGPLSENMRMPELRSLEELESLTRSKWGIPEFSHFPHSSLVNIETAIVR